MEPSGEHVPPDHEHDTLGSGRSCSLCRADEENLSNVPNWRLAQELRRRADWAQSTVRPDGTAVYTIVFDLTETPFQVLHDDVHDGVGLLIRSNGEDYTLGLWNALDGWGGHVRMPRTVLYDALDVQPKPRRKPCPVKCPCICHDTGGSGHDHPGQPCPGKAS